MTTLFLLLLPRSKVVTRMHSLGRRAGTSLVLIAILTMGCGGSRNHIDVAIDVLTAEFETVFVLRPSVLAAYPAQGQSALLLPFADLVELVEMVSAQQTGAALQGLFVVAVGAKNFRPPSGASGLGAVQSDSCLSIVFDESRATWIAKLSDLARRDAVDGMGRISLQGNEGSSGERLVYVASIQSGLTVICNNENVIATTVARFSSPRGGGRNPIVSALSGLPFWGVRFYGVRQQFPTAAGTSEISADASALSLGLHEEGSVVVQLHAAGDDTATALKRIALMPAFRRSSGNVWEAALQIPASGGGEEWLLVMSLFGFGLYD